MTDSHDRGLIEADVELETDWLTTLDTLADTEADCKALTLSETDLRTFTIQIFCRYRLTR